MNILCLPGIVKAKFILSKKLKNGEEIKLHIGSGRNYLENWINIDLSKRTKKDLSFDVRKGIPFPSNSVNYIFSEHFIEHLTYEEGLFYFSEVFRVLKNGGVLRTAFPDLDVIIESYQNDSWREKEWVKLIGAQWYPSRCFMLNECIRENGLHKYMYNVDDITELQKKVGFLCDDIYVIEVMKSSYKQLIEIERRKDSSVVESVKNIK